MTSQATLRSSTKVGKFLPTPILFQLQVLIFTPIISIAQVLGSVKVSTQFLALITIMSEVTLSFLITVIPGFHLSIILERYQGTWRSRRPS